MIRPMLFASLLLAPLPLAAAAPSPSIAGTWTNPKHSVTVRIAPCGGGALCGRVISASASAKDKAAAAGTLRLVGTQLMSDLQPAGPGIWQGMVFVPDHNIRAEGTLRMTGPRTLDVEGCAMGGLLCKSQQWTRVGGSAKARRRR